ARAAREHSAVRQGGAMHVVITGCGRTGRALAIRLDAEGDEVTVIELDEAAGIAHAEAFVALTPNDSANIVSARVARDVYQVPHVLARLHDPAHAPVYTELGIATVASVPTTVNRLIQLLHHRTLEPHQTFGNGETLLVRSRVPAYLAGRRVAEFNVPGEIGVVELSRAGHSSIPEPSAALADGDVLSFIVAAASLGRLRSFLGG